MPTYCYRRTDNGGLVELPMSIAEMLERQDAEGRITLDDGAIATRDYPAEFAHVSTCPGNWPLHSDAAGVNPSQIGEAEAHSRKIGIPTHFDRHGRAIFTGSEHRRRYCKAIGLIDRNGGYRDPVPS